MHALHQVKRFARNMVTPLAATLFPTRWKEFNELYYWKERKKVEGDLSNLHYAHFYTTHFGLDGSFYADKVILDIGCGPRGSLEWADMTARRIGLDPLAREYFDLGARTHKMEYLDAPSEKIPLDDGACDAVFSFNSLDHVADIDKTIAEIKRVTRPGGIFLLLVEVNHPPTASEPHELSQSRLIGSLAPEFICNDIKMYRPVTKGLYDSILAGQLLAEPYTVTETGFLSAHFLRTPLHA